MFSKILKSQDSTVRCVITGDSKIGKSVLATTFANKETVDLYEETIFDTFSGQTDVKDKLVQVGIFDTSGQVEHESIRMYCYANSEVFIVTYSVIDRQSFDNVRDIWLPEAIKCKTGNQKIILVGFQSEVNQDGKHNTKDVVLSEEGKSLADQFKVKLFMEVSPASTRGSNEVFEETVKAAIKGRKLVKQLLSSCCVR